MTLPNFPTESRCVICELGSKQESLASTNMFGSPDLDTRPPEMRRSTMEYWLQQCPHCGYCAAHISKDVGITRAFIESPTYQEQRFNPRFPALANAFLCKSILEETTGELSSAAWSAIHAAWVSDDYDEPAAAATCRRRALDLWKRGAANGQALTENSEVDISITADLLRRVGEHESVRLLVSDALNEITDETIRKLLRYQHTLASREDTACHTVEDAFKNRE